MATPQQLLDEMKGTIRKYKEASGYDKGELFVVPSNAELDEDGDEPEVVEVIGGEQTIYYDCPVQFLHTHTEAFTQLQLTEDIRLHELFKVGNVIDFRSSKFELTGGDPKSLKPFTVVVRKCREGTQG
eukprot:278626_1